MSEETHMNDEQRAQMVQTLRDTITSAEQTIQSAKSQLLRMEGKKKSGRRRKVDESQGAVVEGTFDGQVMIGSDGKQYPVPANYASKSKLIQGDHLKLTIVPDGTFIYKQIGPAPRHNQIGIVTQDVRGNHFVVCDGKPYKVLLASVTYFKAGPGDEVVLVTPQDDDAQWGAIENILKHSDDPTNTPVIETPAFDAEAAPQAATASSMLTGDTSIAEEWTPSAEELAKEIAPAAQEPVEEVSAKPTTPATDPVVAAPTTTPEESAPAVETVDDEWVPDIDAIEKEIRAEMEQLQKKESA